MPNSCLSFKLPELNILSLRRGNSQSSLQHPSPSNPYCVVIDFTSVTEKECGKLDTMNEKKYQSIFENTIEDKPLNSKIEFELKFNYSTVNLNLLQHDKQDIFKCNCLRYAENQLQFCSHLVSALDHVFRYFLFGKSEHSNPMKKALKLLIQENMVTILDRLGIELDDEDLYGDQRVLDFISGTILTKKSS